MFLVQRGLDSRQNGPRWDQGLLFRNEKRFFYYRWYAIFWSVD